MRKSGNLFQPQYQISCCHLTRGCATSSSAQYSQFWIYCWSRDKVSLAWSIALARLFSATKRKLQAITIHYALQNTNFSFLSRKEIRIVIVDLSLYRETVTH